MTLMAVGCRRTIDMPVVRGWQGSGAGPYCFREPSDHAARMYATQPEYIDAPAYAHLFCRAQLGEDCALVECRRTALKLAGRLMSHVFLETMMKHMTVLKLTLSLFAF